MAAFTIDDRNTMSRGIDHLNVWFNNNLLAPVRNECIYTAKEIDEAYGLIEAARAHLCSFSERNDSVTLDDSHLPIYKQAVIVGRHLVAMSIEQRGQNVHHSGIISTLRKELEPYDHLIGQESFQETVPTEFPRLTAFISLQRAETWLMQSEPASALSPRVYDEKFHILQAPHLFEKDLHYFRKQCDLRGTPDRTVRDVVD